jgi:hypothetical protein
MDSLGVEDWEQAQSIYILTYMSVKAAEMPHNQN